MSAPPLRPAPATTAPAAPERAGRNGAGSSRHGPSPELAAFGAGRGEPYVRLLAGQDMASLSLRGADGSSHRLDAGSWVRPAGEADLTVIDRATGPLLDVGCGPGRMLHAAGARSLPALGIDVMPHAVERARQAGGLALRRSVFERLPLEGRWRSLLLLDGNIGIGGAPALLLRRCAELVAEGGQVLVEVDADADLAVVGHCTLVDDDGRESSPFPWARVGWAAAAALASDAGLVVVEHWDAAGRHFVRAARAARTTAMREARSAIAASASSTAQMTASAMP
ncbi:methyltransferase type 11 [Agromyces luteolus]|uniref:class I SAM-dependent methyltransferase n=1 Tax=Agromyces luteolus TaxID=88373 RepID=UPI00197AD8C5|nr:class I SAM-dependent methyltransferase [Agromyces luteolus]GLK26182.1 methyltransferase type 11 [Agromyces luteolus]